MHAIGVQLFSLPFLLEANFEKAMQMLSKMGYKELELFGPYPYSDSSAKKSWKEAVPQLGFSGSGYFGLSEDEVAAILEANALKVPSIHIDLDTALYHMDALAAASETLGFTYISLPMIPEEQRTCLDDYKRIADTFNSIGEKAAAVGLKFTYHNHGYGLSELEGQIPFQLILDSTDASKVFFEMDLFWTTAGRADPLYYLENNPGRFPLLHVKDMKSKVQFSGDGGTVDQWVALFPDMTTAGDGVLDLPRIIATAKQSGTQHFFVEQDMVQSPEIALKRSLDYLRDL